MDATANLLSQNLRSVCLNVSLEPTEDIHSLLDQVLKVLLDEKIPEPTKLKIVQFLELETSAFLCDVTNLELLYATLKNVFDTASSKSSQILIGQYLISITTVLLSAVEKFPGKELDMLFSQHVNELLNVLQQTNNPSNVYVRSVAASCLTELELCFPTLLKQCVESVYTLAVTERSAAHQQYTSLLALLMRNALPDIEVEAPLWKKNLSIDFGDKCVCQKTCFEQFSLEKNNQLMSFLVDQLALCTCEGVVWVTSHIIDMLLHNTQLRASSQVLKPLVFNYIYTYNVSTFHLVLWLERAFGDALFDGQEHILLLRQLLLNSNHPFLSAFTRLIYLHFLTSYLSHNPSQLSNLVDSKLLLPNCFDGPEVQLQKFILLNTLMKSSRDSNIPLRIITSFARQMKGKKSVKFKSAFTKALYILAQKPSGISLDEFSRILTQGATDDITIVPFVLHLVGKVRDKYPQSVQSSHALDSLVFAFTQPDSPVVLSTFALTVDIFQQAVVQKCSLGCLKSLLMYLHRHVLCDGMCNRLSWQLGHKILKLCYTIMKEYRVSSVYNELCDILEAFVSKSGNLDIEDRARLYQGLLLTLSDKKLKVVLQSPKHTLPRVLSDESKYHSKSSIQKLEKPVIKLYKEGHFISSDAVWNVPVSDSEDPVKEYKKFIASEPSLRNLVLKIALSVTQEFEDINIFEALALFINVPEEWGKIDPVMVGHFNRGWGKHTDEERTFHVICHPMYPQTTDAFVRAEFSLENICHFCMLEPFNIEFVDYFCQLPISSDVNESETFLLALWDSFEDEYHSVMTMHCEEELMKSVLDENLGNFIVNKKDNIFYAAMYLPPGNHLLMKFYIQPCRTLVKMATDYIMILNYTNNFLKKMM